jgi:Bax protein
VPVGDSLVKPIIYTNISGFDKYPYKEAKEKFISLVLPAILIAKYQLELRRDRIKGLSEKKDWDKSDSSFYFDSIKRYKADSFDDLTSKLKTIPTSIVLAQAIVETGWGRSRFFTEGNNLFGVWSGKNNEPRIAAAKTRKDKIIYLKKYIDISHSAVDYFEILLRSRAYRGLRMALLQTSDPFMLLLHLKNYSEQRMVYTKKLEIIIRQNNLTRFDHFQIDPQYLVEDSDGMF